VEAADPQGVIEADGLYKYVYYQTLHIDKTNQQLRLMNQQKQRRGKLLYPEYPLQNTETDCGGCRVGSGTKPDLYFSSPPPAVRSAEFHLARPALLPLKEYN